MDAAKNGDVAEGAATESKVGCEVTSVKMATDRMGDGDAVRCVGAERCKGDVDGGT